MLIEIPVKEICNSSTEEIQKLLLAKSGFSSLLRWGGIAVNQGNALIEVIASPFPEIKLENINESFSNANLGAMIIPTGLGCSIGGFAGDANLHANLAAECFDYLIVNPNIVNGGAWQNIAENMLYVEGFALDLFLKKLIALRPVKSNKIGVLFDKAVPEALIRRELEVIKAAETIWGIDYLGHEISTESCEPKIEILQGNYSSGSVKNPMAILQAAHKLKSKGAEAIALICHLPESPESLGNAYLTGNSPDPIGGIEAILSHLITSQLLIPCAHAPVFQPEEMQNIEIDARVSAEESSFSFLPCVLKGLSRAPKLINKENLHFGDLTAAQVNSFMAPADCWLGSSCSSVAHQKQITSYAVQSNKTGIGLGPEILGFTTKKPANYLELIGYLTAQQKGIKTENIIW